MNVPNDLSPSEAAHALEALARAMEAHLIERGVPGSVRLVETVTA